MTRSINRRGNASLDPRRWQPRPYLRDDLPLFGADVYAGAPPSRTTVSERAPRSAGVVILRSGPNRSATEESR